MAEIEIKNLCKSYKDKKAVNGLTITIQKGELLALLGVNGAGKTTTIKMMSCITKPDSGDAIIGGYSIIKNSEEVKKIIAVSPQETAVAPNLSVRENLELMAGIHGNNFKQSKEKATNIISLFGLLDVEKQKAGTMSGGWQRRLSIAMAIISDPLVLFLDEPTLGLDVLARRELWKIIESLKKNTTIILTTHYLEEAESLSDKIAIMSNGSLKALGTAEELKKKASSDNFEDAFIKIATGEEL